MTSPLTNLANAEPDRLTQFGVNLTHTAASINAATFDNRPTWDNKGKFDSRPGWDNWNKK